MDKAICARCKGKTCLVVCPAVLYKLDKNGEIIFDYAGCLECGTCRVMCKNKGIIKWEYPRGTFGGQFPLWIDQTVDFMKDHSVGSGGVMLGGHMDQIAI